METAELNQKADSIKMLTLQQKNVNCLSHPQAVDIFDARHPERDVLQSTVSSIISKFESTGSGQNTYNEKAHLSICLDVVEHGQTSNYNRYL